METVIFIYLFSSRGDFYTIHDLFFYFRICLTGDDRSGDGDLSHTVDLSF